MKYVKIGNVGFVDAARVTAVTIDDRDIVVQMDPRNSNPSFRIVLDSREQCLEFVAGLLKDLEFAAKEGGAP